MKKYILLFRMATLITLVVSTLLAGTASAAETNPFSVYVERISNGIIGVKFTFQNSMSGNFDGTLNGVQHFDCVLESANTLYCVGPMQPGIKNGLLSIYDTETGDVVFTAFIKSPPRIGGHKKNPCETCPLPEFCPQ